MFGSFKIRPRYGVSMPMKYPDGFIIKVKAEFKDRKEICQAADKGQYSLGKYLADEVNRILTPEEIITAFKNGKEKDILAHAHTVIRRKSIHADWIRLMVDKIASLDSDHSKGNGKSKVKLWDGEIPIENESTVNV